MIFVVAAPYSPAAFHSRGPISPALVLFTAVLHLLVLMGLIFHAHFFGRMRPWGCAASGARPRVGAPRLPTSPLLGNNPKLLHPAGERHRRGVDQHLQVQLSALGASVELKVDAAAHPGSATEAACDSLVAHLPHPAHVLRS